MDLPLSVTTRLAHALRRALGRCTELDGRALGPLGLDLRQYAALAVLGGGPLARQHEVGAVLGLDRTTTAALMRGLAERGLVDRAPLPGNTRTLVLRLTAAGEELRAEGERRLRAAEDEALAPLADAERDVLHRALDRLAGGVRQSGRTA